LENQNTLGNGILVAGAMFSIIKGTQIFLAKQIDCWGSGNGLAF